MEENSEVIRHKNDEIMRLEKKMQDLKRDFKYKDGLNKMDLKIQTRACEEKSKII